MRISLQGERLKLLAYYLYYLFGAYARHDYVAKISYYLEKQEEKEVVYLPRLSFKLTESEKMIPKALEKGKYNRHYSLIMGTILFMSDNHQEKK